ncbi:MAG: pilus assembly protein [Alphaproteobacteria bacterium]|nr:pilus assembly protein [Alphaproteobacteria bacterium]
MMFKTGFKSIESFSRSWLKGEDGVAIMEAAMLFPVMLVLMMGVFDLGNGISLSEKTVTSSQIAADLVSRNRTIEAAGLTDIIEGSKLAFEPYELHGFGIDIVSIRFDENSNPEILWRETQGMSPNDVAVASVVGLAGEGEGMIIVTVKYSYSPLFSKFFTDDLYFTEVAFSRGRRSPTVTWDG